jgi:hypothetical protein
MWAVIGGNMYPIISASQVNNPEVYVELIGRKAIPTDIGQLMGSPDEADSS